MKQPIAPLAILDLDALDLITGGCQVVATPPALQLPTKTITSQAILTSASIAPSAQSMDLVLGGFASSLVEAAPTSQAMVLGTISTGQPMEIGPVEPSVSQAEPVVDAGCNDDEAASCCDDDDDDEAASCSDDNDDDDDDAPAPCGDDDDEAPAAPPVFECGTMDTEPVEPAAEVPSDGGLQCGTMGIEPAVSELAGQVISDVRSIVDRYL